MLHLTRDCLYLITSPLVEAEDDGNVYKNSALTAFLSGTFSEPSFNGQLPQQASDMGRILIFQMGMDPTASMPPAGTFGTNTSFNAGIGPTLTQNPVNMSGATGTITPQTNTTIYGGNLRSTSNTVFLRKF